MKEMLWDLPTKTIDMYSLKKHLKEIPELDQNVPIKELFKSQYENLKKDNLINQIKEKKPDSYIV